MVPKEADPWAQLALGLPKTTGAGPLITLVGVAGFAFIIGRWMWVFTDADSRRGSSRRKSPDARKPS